MRGMALRVAQSRGTAEAAGPVLRQWPTAKLVTVAMCTWFPHAYACQLHAIARRELVRRLHSDDM